MKTSILIIDGAKQIMLTPETKHEKEALKYIEPGESYKVVAKRGSFTDGDEKLGMEIYECQGGYYRAKEDTESIMFIIKPKQDD